MQHSTTTFEKSWPGPRRLVRAMRPRVRIYLYHHSLTVTGNLYTSEALDFGDEAVGIVVSMINL